MISMALYMERRANDILKGVNINDRVPDFKAPNTSAPFRASAKQAARIHAQRDKDDPFAYSRALTLMLAGVYLPSEIKEKSLSL
jgi:hypothetical protein